jgi:hypothetical protein
MPAEAIGVEVAVGIGVVAAVMSVAAVEATGKAACGLAL